MKSCEIVIIDDDKVSQDKLGNMILSIDKDCEVHAYGSIAAYRSSGIRPDAMFLDMDLNGENGFDLYALESIDYPVIVISGHTKYAITGYEYNVFDFLVKPFSLARVRVAMDKLAVSRKLGVKKDKLLISLADSYRIADMSSIIKLEAQGKYTRVTLDDGSSVISSNHLGYFENLLDQGKFFRVHNSCIIHIDKIEKIIKGLQLKVVLSDKSVELVSKRQKSAFLGIFNKA